MKSGGGKSKGASFERDTCVKLSLWVSKGERKDLFWRSAMSGGRSTVARKKGDKNENQAGDISCVGGSGSDWLTTNYCIECKHYDNLDIVGGIVKGTGNLKKFWDKLCIEAKDVHKLPMLIAKQNMLPTLCLLSTKGVEVLGGDNRVFGCRLRNLTRFCIDSWDEIAVVYLFEDLLEKVKTP